MPNSSSTLPSFLCFQMSWGSCGIGFAPQLQCTSLLLLSVSITIRHTGSTTRTTQHRVWPSPPSSPLCQNWINAVLLVLKMGSTPLNDRPSLDDLMSTRTTLAELGYFFLFFFFMCEHHYEARICSFTISVCPLARGDVYLNEFCFSRPKLISLLLPQPHNELTD